MAKAWGITGWVERIAGRSGAAVVPAVLVGIVVIGQLAAPWTATAEDKRTFKYPYKWVYLSAYRLLKVDLECKIDEADEQSGLILFQFEHQGIKSPTSMEIVDLSKEDGASEISVRIKMEKLPSWIESDLMDQLETKIKDDYGDPPPVKKKGGDKDDEDGKGKGKDKDKDKDKDDDEDEDEDDTEEGGGE